MWNTPPHPPPIPGLRNTALQHCNNYIQCTIVLHYYLSKPCGVLSLYILYILIFISISFPASFSQSLLLQECRVWWSDGGDSAQYSAKPNDRGFSGGAGSDGTATHHHPATRLGQVTHCLTLIGHHLTHSLTILNKSSVFIHCVLCFEDELNATVLLHRRNTRRQSGGQESGTDRQHTLGINPYMPSIALLSNLESQHHWFSPYSNHFNPLNIAVFYKSKSFSLQHILNKF